MIRREQSSIRQRRTYGDISQVKNSYSKKDLSPKKNKNWIKILFIIAGSTAVVLFIAGTIAVALISRELPDPEKLSDRQVAQSTKIYDRTGEHLLYEVYQDQKRTMIGLDQVSSYAIKATIAVEDRNFYTHKGVRLTSIIRAAINNVLGRRAGSGGASTLTQQLIKNTIVGNERSYYRKIKEAILAMRLEKKYSKDQIIKMYLNEIPYGSTNYGIESAAQSYFKKNAIDLSLAESATLAALLKKPSAYLNDTQSLKERRNLVLRLMFEQGFISEEEKNQAQEDDLIMNRTTGFIDAPHYVLYVKQLLAEEYGEKTVDQGGLKVITTLDFDKQKMAEAAVKELGDKFADESNANNASLVAIDPKTGQILSLVGSRDFFNNEIDGQYNVAVLGKRQPGSSFKPFVFTAAFEKGYTPETVLYDVITNFDLRTGSSYTPKNYDNKEHGLVTMRYALGNSYNIPAVKALYLVGEKNMADFAKRFGYTTLSEGDYGLSLVLGGAEVNLLEHTNAYATLANEGKYRKPSAILQVFDNNDKEIFAYKKTDGIEAVSSDVAAIISNVLSDDSARQATFGRGGILTLPNRPVAAKTGTTNDVKDAWTMGYTPSLAVGVWVGNTIPSKMSGGGSRLAGQIWNRFMKEALENSPVEQFPELPAQETLKPVLNGSNGVAKVKINRINGKIATSSTPENLIIEKEFLPPYNILHYVIKDDPRGPMPENPESDPQYNNWQEAIYNWAKRENEAGRTIVFSEPPNEFDNFVFDPELIPTLEIYSPTENSSINGRELNIDLSATAPRGISSVTYSINGVIFEVRHQPPFSLSHYLSNIPKGQHILTITASDDLGNSTYQEIPFEITADFDPPNFNWVDSSPIYINQGDFPRLISITPFRWSDIKNIKIQLLGDEVNKLIYTFDINDNLLVNKLSFSWQNSPGAGFYKLIGTLTDNNNRTVVKEIDVVVQ